MAVSRTRREMLATEGIQTWHARTNTLLDSADDDRVSGRTLVSVAWQRPDSHKPALMHTGEYHDEFMRVNGTDVRQLTLNDTYDWDPAWSP